MHFQQDRTQDWRIRAFESAKNDIVRRTYMVTVVWATSGIDIFFSTQLLKPCTVGQLSIRWAKTCNFKKIAHKIEKQQLSQGKNSTTSCHCVKSVDSQWGVNSCEQFWTGVNGCEQVGQVGTGVKSFDQVLIPALRRSYQNRCEVLFFLDCESHASQIWPTLRQSYTISTLSKSP